MGKTHKIRSVIQSTTKTSTITKAMEVVSASKLPHARDRLEKARPFSDLINQMMKTYASSGLAQHPFLTPKHTCHRDGLIILSSDRGLCANLNLGVFKTALTHMSEQPDDYQFQISALGSKAVQFFSRHHTLLSQLSHISDKPSLSDIMPLIHPMIEAYTNGQLDRVYVVHNVFQSTLSQQPTLTQILPIEPFEETKYTAWEYLYEPCKDTVLDKLLRHYLESQLYRKVIENIACEQAARMIAMKNATENAQELINKLNLTYNKIRQADITQEIAEIAAGSDTSEEI